MPAKPKSGELAQARSKTAQARTAKAGGSKRAAAVKRVSKGTASAILDILCRTYPDADCELTFASDFQLLIAVILSAQCTDVTVNKVTPYLFKRFPTAKKLAEAPLAEIKEIIKPTGFFNTKAANIQACAQALVTEFGGTVPATLAELTKLPGVGRKTANVVLGVVHKIPGWTVDTHVQRLSKRLGFTENACPHKIEQDLEDIFPQQDWSKLSITIIWHGRRCCYARRPNCAACPVNQLCPASTVKAF
jgi:endonuclease-3